MSRTPWVFYDDVLDESYFWVVNPNQDAGSHSINKSVNYEVAAGMRRTSGNVDTVDNLISMKGFEQQPFSYSGFVYDKDHFDTLVYWSNKEYPIYLTDDLGRQFKIYISGMEFDRVRSRQNVYKHSYRFTGIILEEL